MTDTAKPDGSRTPYHKSGTVQSWTMAILIICVLGTIAYVADFARWTLAARELALKTQESAVRTYGLIEPAHKSLDARFTDLHNRLLADPPSDASQYIDPPVLVLAHINNDTDDPEVSWPQFEAHLAQVTGKKIQDAIWTNSGDQIGTLAQNSITLVALHAADAPFLVNNYGFEPAAVLANGSGVTGHKMDLIVPANSTINSPADLKGHTLVCTVPSSIVGYRAALVLLAEDDSLRPELDYYVTWSMSQKQSIKGIAKGEYQAAAVSSDRLEKMLAAGTVTSDEYRTIYESQVVPATTIGWFYNLKPDLAQKVKDAILSYQPTTQPSDSSDSDSQSEADADSGYHFVPSDYKADFQLVRLIDDRFEPRLDAKTKETTATAAAAVPATQP
jgi:phosphonate transport system substrate-binding protein